MDGGYENKKMNTVRERLKGRIGVIKYIIPLESKHMAIPLMMRECFVDACNASNVKLMRCLFEADNEIAILAKKLDCPVLSYDSDFYIFDGLYIPYVTVTQKIHRKTVKSSSSYEVEIIRKKPKGQKNWKKSTKKILIENPDEEQNVELKTYNYLDCCIYSVENLIEGQLDKEMLPLFATLIGNDFIEKKVFNHFLHNVRKKKYSKKLSPQQKRIFKIMDFLKQETLKSAIKKIVGHMKLYQREKMLNRIKFVMSGYCMEKSEAFEYFRLHDEFPDAAEGDGLGVTIDDLLASSDEEEEDEESGNDGSENEENSENSTENSEIGENLEEAKNEESKIVELFDKKLKIEDSGEEAEAIEENSENQEESSENESEEGEESEEEEEEEDVEETSDIDETDRESLKFKKLPIPEWFDNVYKSGATPRFLCDILRYRRYINYPQVELFDKPDANEIANPILTMIFSMLHKTEGSYYTYYTRIPKYIRYEVKRFERQNTIEFDPAEKNNVELLKTLFQKEVKNCEKLKIFEKIYEVPESYQLFILSVIYWLNKMDGPDINLLMSVLLCLITLGVVDKKCEKIHRDQGVFMKNYKKYLEEQKKGLKKDPEKSKSEQSLSKSLSSLQKEVTKSEALLAMEKLVSHFSISSKMERKHADFRKNVVHMFSELQAVISNLNALNPLLNFPFENVKIAKCFNGLFVYNMYNNLKSRSDPKDYVKSHIFANSPNLGQYFSTFLEFCEVILPALKMNEVKAEPPKKPTKPKQNKVKKVKPKVQEKVELKVQESDEEEGGFFDANNKFSCLIENC